MKIKNIYLNENNLIHLIEESVYQAINELKSDTYLNAYKSAYERSMDDNEDELKKGRVKAFRNAAIKSMSDESGMYGIFPEEQTQDNQRILPLLNGRYLKIYDSDYKSLNDLIMDVKNGRLLIHCRKMQGEEYENKIYPEIGETVEQSYGEYMDVEEYGEDFVKKLVFASDDLNWVGNIRNCVYFVYSDTFCKSLGDCKIMTIDGNVYTDENLSPSIETGDWFSEEAVSVAAVIDFNKNA
jgi:hypothetical protein